MIRRPDAPRFRSRALLIAVGYSAFFCWIVCESKKANRAGATPAAVRVAGSVKLPATSADWATMARSERRNATEAGASADRLRKTLGQLPKGSAESRSSLRHLQRVEAARDRAIAQAERFEILAAQAREEERRAAKAKAAKGSGRL